MRGAYSWLAERSHAHPLPFAESTACWPAQVLGLRFYGSPWTVPCGRDWAFQEPDTEEGLGRRFGAIPPEGARVAERLASAAHPLHTGPHADRRALSSGVDVLVTHQPPVGLGDAGGVGHPGSCMLLRRLEALAAPPLLHVFGHIHAGHGVHAHATLDRRGRFNHRKLDRRRRHQVTGPPPASSCAGRRL